MMNRKSVGLGLGLVGLAMGGCGKSGSSPSSVTVTLPEWQVAAGQVSLKCLYQGLHNPQPLNVQKFLTSQGQGGHHLIAFISTTSLPDGTLVDCASASSMLSFRPLLEQITKD